jgi:hypothetical protein
MVRSAARVPPYVNLHSTNAASSQCTQTRVMETGACPTQAAIHQVRYRSHDPALPYQGSRACASPRPPRAAGLRTTAAAPSFPCRAPCAITNTAQRLVAVAKATRFRVEALQLGRRGANLCVDAASRSQSSLETKAKQRVASERCRTNCAVSRPRGCQPCVSDRCHIISSQNSRLGPSGAPWSPIERWSSDPPPLDVCLRRANG